MGDISAHFNRSEFSCKCGCGFDTVDTDLLTLCEIIRELNGDVSLTPNSGCRCKDHNRKEGGSVLSQHLLGRAADLPVRNPEEVYKKLCNLYPNIYGFGLYNNFIHVDSRNDKARWRG